MDIDWKVKPSAANYVFSSVGVILGTVAAHYIPKIRERRRIAREARLRVENTKIVVVDAAEGSPIDIATKKYKEGK